ncbi:MAG: helix-turn-helix domain-containing protein [Thiohalomonadales bacterium]
MPKLKKEINLFSKRFAEALVLNNLECKTYKELGELLGISRSHAYELRNNKKLPSAYTGSILAEALNVSFEWLLIGNGVPTRMYLNDSEAKLISRYLLLNKKNQSRLYKFMFKLLEDTYE